MSSQRCPVCEQRIEPADLNASLIRCPHCKVRFMTPESSVASVLARAPDGEIPAGEIELTDDFKGRFRLGRILGVGCFGTVYHAEEVATGRPVAVKFLTQQTSRDVLARFLLEGKLLKEIRHPNVLEVMEVQEIGGHPYMICEYVDGGSLAQRLEGKKRLATAEATTIILDVLAGLHACHMRGVVHRDLKPGNILLTGSGQAKVADLGIAKDYSSGSPNLTIPGMILGTPKYMAPEQIRGAPVVIASDLYAVGTIYYELLSGEAPFKGATWVDFARAHEQDRPRSISVLAPETPEGIANVIHRALAKRTASRPASAEEFAAAIRRSLERAAEEPAAAEATEPRPAPGAIVRDLLAGALAALAELPATLKVGIGAAALVALLFVLFHSGSASRYHGGRSSIGVDPSGAPAAPRQPTAAPSGASLPSTGPDPGSTAPETPAPERSIAAGTRPSVVTPRSPSLPEARLDPETSLGADAFRHTVDPIQIGFTADGRQVFSLDGSGTVRTLDLAGGGPPRSFSVGNDTVLVTRDLRRSIHASPTLGSLQLKDIATGAQVWTVTGLARGLTRVCRSPDDQLLLVGENDGAIRLIAVETGRVVWSVKAHGRAVAAVALSSSGTRAVSTDRGPPAASGPPRSPRASGEAVQQGYGQPQAFFTPPSTRSPSPEEDRCRVHLWDGASGHLLHFFVVPEGEATAVAVSPDGEIVAVGGTRPTFSTGDRHSNDLSSHDAPHGASPATAVVYSDDLRVYVGRASGQLDVFSATNQFAREATAETRHDGVRHLALSPDGRFVATAGPDLTLRVWQAGTVTPAVPAPGHAGKIRSIELSRDGRLIASAGHDGTVCCWEAATGRALWTFDGWAREAVHGIGFSGDGQLLALFGEEDGHVAVVVVETGTGRVRWRAAGDGRCDGVLVRFQEAGPRPMIVGLAGDGRLFTRGLHDPDPTPLRESPPQPALVTMSADGTLGLWEMADARLRLAGASGAPVVGTYPVPGGGAGLSAAERRLTALSADARFVMVAGKRALQLYRAADGRSLGKVVPGRTKAVALCPDGRAVVALAGDLLRVIDVATGQDLAWFRDVENVLDGPIAVSPDASLVLVGATNGSIQTFRLVRPPAR